MPHAKIEIDKFHVVKLANEALEKIRKANRQNVSAKVWRNLWCWFFHTDWGYRRGYILNPLSTLFSDYPKKVKPFASLDMLYLKGVTVVR